MKTETLGPVRILRALDGRHATVRHGGQITRIINHNDPVEVERMVDAELDYLRGEARETIDAIDARQSQRAAAAHPGPAVAAGDYGQPSTPPVAVVAPVNIPSEWHDDPPSPAEQLRSARRELNLDARVRELEVDVEGLRIALRQLRGELTG